MTAATNYLEAKILEHIFENAISGGSAYDTSSTTWYVSLHTADPTESGSFTNEQQTNADGARADYTRKQISFAAVNTAGDTVSISNTGAITFPQAAANYSAAITHIGISDASDAGNMIFKGALSTPKTVTSGDVFQINSGSLTITLD